MSPCTPTILNQGGGGASGWAQIQISQLIFYLEWDQYQHFCFKEQMLGSIFKAPLHDRGRTLHNNLFIFKDFVQIIHTKIVGNYKCPYFSMCLIVDIKFHTFVRYQNLARVLFLIQWSKSPTQSDKLE